MDKLDWKKYLSEGVLLALVPLVAYLLKFTFDAGYAFYFKVPNSLSSFSISSIFSSIFTLGSASLIMFYYLAQNVELRRRPGLYGTVMDNNFLIFAFTLITYSFFSELKFIWIPFSVLSAICLLRFFLLPLMWQRKIKGYRKKLHADVDRIAQIKRDSIADHVFDFSLYRHTFFVVAVFGILAISYGAGFSKAQSQKEYYILEKDTSWVAVKFVDQNVVLVKREKDQLQNKMIVKQLTEPGLVLSLEKIGKLK